MTLDAIGFGALNVDKLYRVNRIAGEDEESFVIDFQEETGGSAANTIVGLARLGLKTGYIGKVANDREGRLLLADFKKEMVDLGEIKISEEGRSGTVMGYVDERGERALYVDPGVNDLLEFKEINLEYASCAKFLHLTSFVATKPFEAQKKLVSMIPAEVKISFDPGTLYSRKGLAALKPLIERSFIALPSERELRMITGEGYVKGSKILLREGVSVVAVKLGERGCYVTNGLESHLIEPYKVRVVDTTGAGDAFCAGFLYGLIKNKDLYECGRLGNFVASRCITKIGARAGLMRLPDIFNL